VFNRNNGVDFGSQRLPENSLGRAIGNGLSLVEGLTSMIGGAAMAVGELPDGNEQMTTEEFVTAVRTQAMDAAVRITVETLIKPVGRRPDTESLNVSDWYGTLSADGRAYVETVARKAAFSAIFGFFAILDGVRPVEGVGEKGIFELIFEKGATRVLLNDPAQELLHDAFTRVAR